MKAAVLHDGASAPTVEDVPSPEPGAGQLELRVLAASLNPVDLWIAMGQHPVFRPERPYVPGFEGVGRVTGGGGTAGQRVWWLGGVGALAEQAIAQIDDAVDVPDALSDVEAAAIGIAGLAAWLALVERAGVSPGERVLVLGASGAVGRFAVQIARAVGAERVVGAARTGSDDLHELGAHAFVSLAEMEGLTDRLLDAEPRGYDVVIDPLFGAPLEAALEAAAPNARVVCLSALAGGPVSLSNAIFEKGLSIIGHRNSATEASVRRAAYLALAEKVVSGEIRVGAETCGLEDIADAWLRQAGSPHCKLVVLP